MSDNWRNYNVTQSILMSHQKHFIWRFCCVFQYLISSLTWCPGQKAYQSDTPRYLIRKNATLKYFHKFLVDNTECGNITRQVVTYLLYQFLTLKSPDVSSPNVCMYWSISLIFRNPCVYITPCMVPPNQQSPTITLTLVLDARKELVPFLHSPCL